MRSQIASFFPLVLKIFSFVYYYILALVILVLLQFGVFRCYHPLV